MVIKLTKVEKVFAAILFIAVAAFVPEIIYLVDLGGIEVFVTFIVLYLQPLTNKLYQFKDKLICHWLIAKQALFDSAIAKPKVFAFQGVLCASVLALTGSMVFSLAFLAPTLLANSLLI